MSDTTNVHVSGTGTPLVLVHGVGLDHTMWDLVVEPLTSTHRVIRFDLLGHGETVDPPGPRTLDDFVDQLLGVIDAHGDGHAAVVGSSLGALISLAAAAHRPEAIDRLVTANIIYGRTPEQAAGVEGRLALTEQQGMGPVADLAIDRWFSPAWQTQHPELVDQVRSRLRSNDVAAYLKAYRVLATADLAADGTAARIICPVLAVTGELDPGSTPTMTTRLADDVDRGSAVILDGLRHLPSIEDPRCFADAVISFLTDSYPTGR